VKKNLFVSRATRQGQISFLTKTFGRGTDFVCRDKIVKANGGTHVIQTFLSEEISEETQIKGRTARQGDPGSYSMVLLDKSLEKYMITLKEIDDVRNGREISVQLNNIGHFFGLTNNEYKIKHLYELLDSKRKDFFFLVYNMQALKNELLKLKNITFKQLNY